jgi:hypothetical protein
MTPRERANVLIDALIGGELSGEPQFRVPEGSSFRLYAWKMRGADDVKVIAALDDESAARIAVRARIDLCEMSEEHALEAVRHEDYIGPVDPDVLFQGESPLWDGAGRLSDAVAKV